MEKKRNSTGRSARTTIRRTPARARTQGADLAGIFNFAARNLAANRATLNQADMENHNHGDNMAQAFKMIAKAMAQERGAPPSQQLRHASEYLAQHADNGSAHVYSQGLAQAAQQFQGQQSITPDNAMLLLQSLLGGGQQTTSQAGADLLGSLLGGQQVKQTEGIDLAALVSAGLTFMSAKQQGQDNVQAALSALMSSGPMAQRPHRQQSGQLVGNALLQAIASMARRR
ncbi:MAG: DAK2 domain-containing protein [Chloroflexota bacterium]|nr:DAK2 domain-containing protein [Chloroflexota bacterium]